MWSISDKVKFRGPAAALLGVLLAACGGSAYDAPGLANGSGAALVTLQDAGGDFLSYTVDVTSVKLRKASGAMVETLPATARVDFTQLVDLSELISAGQVPAGDYVAATVTLDYGNADISADDGNGGSVTLTPQDADGNALTGPMEMSVQLDNRHHLVITPGRTARLAFDFNLAASNSVDLAGASVAVAPLIQASVVPPAELPIRIRGLLASTDAATGSYAVKVRPFHLGSGNAGTVTVHTTAATQFEIDGSAYSGAAGLAVLAAEPANTVTLARGVIATADLAFTATHVFAGSSVEARTTDRVRGDVVARSGSVLTVRGATLDRRDGSFEFMRGDVTVNMAGTTVITEEGQSGSFSLADVSVGQRIWATGTVHVDNSTGAATLDATAGHIRLEITPLWGLITGSIGSPLTLALQAIDGRDPARYNFAGSGANTATDANPAAFAVDTGTLDLSELTTNAPVRVFGFPMPFATAGATDFRAQTLVSYANVQNQLFVTWAHGGSSDAFPGLHGGSAALDLDLAGVGILHFLQTGPLRVDLLSLGSPPQIAGDSMAATMSYAIGHVKSRRIENYNLYGDFIDALASDMNGTKVLSIAANGRYAPLTGIFTANGVAVLLVD